MVRLAGTLEVHQGSGRLRSGKSASVDSREDRGDRERIAAGNGPGTGVVPQKQSPRNRILAAYDLTFGMPKGYSVAALVGGDARFLQIGERAQRAALDAGQEYARARMGGSREPENSANWAAAIFRHVTARPTEGHAPNPHLHWHTVIFNMSRSADGKVRALNPEEMFKVQRYMDAIFSARNREWRSGARLPDQDTRPRSSDGNRRLLK